MALIKNKLINIENISVTIEKKNEKLYEDRKNEKLYEDRKLLYTELAKIIEQFPKRVPTEILRSAHYDVPKFQGNYDIVIQTLNNKIDDSENKRLKAAIRAKDKNRIQSIQTEIDNWKHAIEELKENKDEFESANAMYEEYKKKNSGKIEIIFSQAVENGIVELDTFLNNAYGRSGRHFEEDIVRQYKRELHFAMRRDIGTL